MASLDRIGKEGFRHWYERQLIECHLWLVSCFLGIIMTASGIEIFGRASRPLGAFLMLGGAVLALAGWQRYRRMLDVAERLGELAACPKCQAYARFDILSAGPMPLPEGDDPLVERAADSLWLRARCRKCGEEWLMK